MQNYVSALNDFKSKKKKKNKTICDVCYGILYKLYTHDEQHNTNNFIQVAGNSIVRISFEAI